MRGPREKPAQAFAALPAGEALAVGHTSLRWAFPSCSSLLDPSPTELQPPNPAHSGLRAKPAHWVVPDVSMEHLGTTFAFVLLAGAPHETQTAGREGGTNTRNKLENGHMEAKNPSMVWVLPFHPSCHSFLCTQGTQHLHTGTDSSSFPAQPMPGINKHPQIPPDTQPCTQTLPSSFPESRAHPSLQCVQLPSLSGRSRAIPWDAVPGNTLHPSLCCCSPLLQCQALCRAALGSAVCQRCLTPAGIVPVTIPSHPSRQGQPSAMPPNRDVQLHKNSLFFIYGCETILIPSG